MYIFKAAALLIIDDLRHSRWSSWGQFSVCFILFLILMCQNRLCALNSLVSEIYRSDVIINPSSVNTTLITCIVAMRLSNAQHASEAASAS